MEHPDKRLQENQRQFLEQLPEYKREEHARLFRFGNATYIYHSQADGQEPTEIEYKEWLNGLPENIRIDMKKKGFEKCKSILSFTRYVNEKNDIGMDDWMKKNLTAEDYNYYIESKNTI